MRRLIVTMALISAIAVPTTSNALWLSGFGGYNTYSMSDVNDELNALNDLIYPYSIDEINGGMLYGVGLGLPVGSGIDLIAYYERLSASSDVGDATGSIDYDFSANAFKAGLLLSFPSPAGFQLGIGGLIGILSSAGEISISQTGVASISGGVSGSDLLLEAFLNGDYWVAPRVGLFGSAGFRYAKVSEIEVLGNPVYTAGGDRYSVDYSGIAIRVGLKIDLPTGP